MSEKADAGAAGETVETASNDAIGRDPSLLIVDDDGPFVRRLARAMEQRGFTVEIAESVADGIAQAKRHPPKYAVVDLRLGDGSGLDVIEAIRGCRDDTRIIMLTGYGNIATAVNAVKLGAVDYLSKPADADEVYNALVQSDGDKA
ncbi:MAG: response regulator, partial [Pararhizobium sp.]